MGGRAVGVLGGHGHTLAALAVSAQKTCQNRKFPPGAPPASAERGAERGQPHSFWKIKSLHQNGCG